MFYEIKEMKINGVDIKFSDGKLTLENSGYSKSWTVELSNIQSSAEVLEFSNKSSGEGCDIWTTEGNRFEGKVIFKSFSFQPLGGITILIGSGPLKTIE